MNNTVSAKNEKKNKDCEISNFLCHLIESSQASLQKKVLASNSVNHKI